MRSRRRAYPAATLVVALLLAGACRPPDGDGVTTASTETADATTASSGDPATTDATTETSETTGDAETTATTSGETSAPSTTSEPSTTSAPTTTTGETDGEELCAQATGLGDEPGCYEYDAVERFWLPEEPDDEYCCPLAAPVFDCGHPAVCPTLEICGDCEANKLDHAVAACILTALKEQTPATHTVRADPWAPEIQRVTSYELLADGSVLRRIQETRSDGCEHHERRVSPREPAFYEACLAEVDDDALIACFDALVEDACVEAAPACP